jgi:hypothetical protein
LTEQTAAAVVVASQHFGADGPFRYVLIAVSVITVGRLWLWRASPFRAAAQRGGWRLASAVLSSLSMVAFGIGIASGQPVTVAGAFIVGAPLTWFLLIRFARDGSQPAKPAE